MNIKSLNIDTTILKYSSLWTKWWIQQLQIKYKAYFLKKFKNQIKFFFSKLNYHLYAELKSSLVH